MIKEFFVSYVIQLLFTVGLLVLFGFLIAFLNRMFYTNFGSAGKAVCYITGFFGTPVHELSHALFCLIFCHKINEIKLFNVGDDGTLGYVSHSYNPKNLYQKTGNFFIGIAPIVVISVILYLLVNYLIPDLKRDLISIAGSMSASGINGFFKGIGQIFLKIFSYMIYPRFWIYVAVGIFLVPHMTLSAEDIKGAASGLLFLALALLIADALIYFIFNSFFPTFNAVFVKIGAFMLTFFTLAVFVSLLELILSLIYRLAFSKDKQTS